MILELKKDIKRLPFQNIKPVKNLGKMTKMEKTGKCSKFVFKNSPTE